MIELDLLYNRISASLLPYVESIEYVDACKGKPSTLSVTLCNADGRFTREWACTKGDALSLKMGPAEPELLSIDTVGVQPVPRLVTWKASARPATTKSPANRGSGSHPPSSGALVSDKKSWDSLVDVSIRVVAQRVCEECGLTLRYTASVNPKVPRLVRFKESGYHLMERICRKYALSIRATASELQINSRPASASSPEADGQKAIEIPASAVKTVSASSAVEAGKVQSARVDPRSGTTVRMVQGDGDGGIVSLDFDAASDIYSDAVKDAQASTIEVLPDARFVAGVLVKIDGYDLRLVTEMRYKRTGDSENMTLLTRGA